MTEQQEKKFKTFQRMLKAEQSTDIRCVSKQGQKKL